MGIPREFQVPIILRGAGQPFTTAPASTTAPPSWMVELAVCKFPYESTRIQSRRNSICFAGQISELRMQWTLARHLLLPNEGMILAEPENFRVESLDLSAFDPYLECAGRSLNGTSDPAINCERCELKLRNFVTTDCEQLQ